MQCWQKVYRRQRKKMFRSNSATRLAVDTLSCLAQRRGFLFKLELLLLGETDTGRLLIKNDPLKQLITRVKGNVCYQLISKHHITLISAVVTFGQICNVWSDF